jgi:hypothetical protein
MIKDLESNATWGPTDHQVEGASGMQDRVAGELRDAQFRVRNQLPVPELLKHGRSGAPGPPATLRRSVEAIVVHHDIRHSWALGQPHPKGTLVRR